MSVLKEWRCALHGSFEGTHPICPAMGCESERVEREFRTAPAIASGLARRTDAGLRATADKMGIRNWRSSLRAGDVSYAGRAAEAGSDKALQLQAGAPVMLWGSEVQKVMGKSMGELTQAAAAPLARPGTHPNDPYLTHNNALRAIGTESTLFTSPLPPAERTYHRADTKDPA